MTLLEAVSEFVREFGSDGLYSQAAGEWSVFWPDEDITDNNGVRVIRKRIGDWSVCGLYAPWRIVK